MSINYRVPVLESYEFQSAILDKDLSTPPITPDKGNRYLVKSSGTGVWAGKDNNISWFDGVIWKFDAPLAGTILYVIDEGKYYSYNGSIWSEYIGQQGPTGPQGPAGPLNQVYDAELGMIIISL